MDNKPDMIDEKTTRRWAQELIDFAQAAPEEAQTMMGGPLPDVKDAQDDARRYLEELDGSGPTQKRKKEFLDLFFSHKVIQAMEVSASVEYNPDKGELELIDPSMDFESWIRVIVAELLADKPYAEIKKCELRECGKFFVRNLNPAPVGRRQLFCSSACGNINDTRAKRYRDRSRGITI